MRHIILFAALLLMGAGCTTDSLPSFWGPSDFDRKVKCTELMNDYLAREPIKGYSTNRQSVCYSKKLNSCVMVNEYYWDGSPLNQGDLVGYWARDLLAQRGLGGEEFEGKPGKLAIEEESERDAAVVEYKKDIECIE